MNVGVNTAVFNEEGELLLTKRDDFGVWCLPGGRVEDGETLPQAALRETFEETGLQVSLTGVVGIYSVPLTTSWVNLIISFKAQVVGGSFNPQPGEVVEMAYFDRASIPPQLLWGQRQRILDAFDCTGGGTAWAQYIPYDKIISRAELYQMRDESNLSNVTFYEKTFGFDTHPSDHSELGSR